MPSTLKSYLSTTYIVIQKVDLKLRSNTCATRIRIIKRYFTKRKYTYVCMDIIYLFKMTWRHLVRKEKRNAASVFKPTSIIRRRIGTMSSSFHGFHQMLVLVFHGLKTLSSFGSVSLCKDNVTFS